jgi:hypothetical protein
MNAKTWRVYAIFDASDIQKALAGYEQLTGQKPNRVLVSSKAPAELLAQVEQYGLVCKVEGGILARDIWLTCEEEEKCLSVR